jgi:hypothetical protein
MRDATNFLPTIEYRHASDIGLLNSSLVFRGSTLTMRAGARQQLRREAGVRLWQHKA